MKAYGTRCLMLVLFALGVFLGSFLGIRRQAGKDSMQLATTQEQVSDLIIENKMLEIEKNILLDYITMKSLKGELKADGPIATKL